MNAVVLIGIGVAIGTVCSVTIKALWSKYVSPKVEVAEAKVSKISESIAKSS